MIIIVLTYKELLGSHKELLGSHNDISIHQKHLAETFVYWSIKVHNESEPRIRVGVLLKNLVSYNLADI